MSDESQPPTEPNPGQPLTDDDELELLLEQFSGSNNGYKTRVERWDVLERRYVQLVTLPLTKDVLEVIQRDWGGGRYRGRIVDANYSYKPGALSFVIAGEPLNGPPPAPFMPPPREPPVVRSLDDGATTSAAIKQLADHLDRSERATLAALERLHATPAKPDTVAMVTAIGSIAVPIILKLLDSSRGKGALTIEDVRGLLDARGASSGPKDMLEMVRELLEIQATLSAGGGGSGNESTAQAALRMFGPVLSRMMTGEPNGPAAPASPRAIAPAAPAAPTPAAPVMSIPSPSVPVPVSATDPTVDEPIWARELASAVGQLERVARDGGDARDFAESILSFFMPSYHKGLLRELVAHPDAQQQVVTRFPQLGAYPQWLADFIDEARIIFGFIAPPTEEPV